MRRSQAEGVRESSSTTELLCVSAIDVVAEEDFETFARWRPLPEIARYACENIFQQFDFAVDIADDIGPEPRR